MATVEMARSRRDEYSEMTRSALLDSAAKLFAEQGFAATSLDEVAADARVTKGAVYHHFPNKQALFEAVAERLHQQTCDQVIDAASAVADPWSSAVAGFDAFLDRCLDPLYQRLCFEESPSVMGFRSWWERGEEREIGLIRGMLHNLHRAGLVDSSDLESLTHLLFGWMTAVALSLARAENPGAERRRVREATLRLIAGLRPDGTPAPKVKPARRR